MTTTTKRKLSDKELANLQPMAALKSPEERRSVHASARLTTATKEKLTEILNQKKLSLADFLEKIANEQYVIIEK